ncbi:MAG: NUDIX domain-containing protein [Candidatus Peribacteria bacterium]|jgi:ADP-ribose pyrophosphatase YjhB (NUDIX family)|nr:NUDIX domain-containing protein [Candidatus Peribacteria bacterium]
MTLQTTLVFLFNLQGQLLLAMKKRGFGVGKWSGPGGKVEEGESISQAAVREVEEEV